MVSIMSKTGQQIRERDALESVCRYGSFSINRQDGLWSAYQSLKRRGVITIEPMGAGRWHVRLAGALRNAFLNGEDMTQYAQGETP